MNEQIAVSNLKEIGVLYEGDIFEFACLILKVNHAKDEGTNSTSYHTVNGLFKDYAMVARLNSNQVLAVAIKHGLPLGAIVVSDREENHLR
jgi:hypothetical protein